MTVKDSSLSRMENTIDLDVDWGKQAGLGWISEESTIYSWLNDHTSPCLWIKGSAVYARSFLSGFLDGYKIRNASSSYIPVTFAIDGRIREQSDVAVQLIEDCQHSLLYASRWQDEVQRQILEDQKHSLRKSRFMDPYNRKLSMSQLNHYFSEMLHLLQDEEMLLVIDGLDCIHDESERDRVCKLLADATRYRPRPGIRLIVSTSAAYTHQSLNDMSVCINLDENPIASTHAPCHPCAMVPARDSLYWNNLYAVMLSSMEGCNLKDIKIILGFVLCAARPLHLSELREMLRCCAARIEISRSSLRRYCTRVLVIDEQDRIGFIHQDARNYVINTFDLKSNNDSLLETQSELARICLFALQSVQVVESLTRRQHESPLYCNDQTLSSYSQQYWYYHYRLAERHSKFLAFHLSSRVQEGFQLQYACLSEKFAYLQDDSSGPRPKRIPSKVLRSLSLRFGIRYSFEELAKLELESGADITIDDTILAALAGLPTDLISRGRKESPLHMAAKSATASLVEILLGLGADANARDSNGHTPLQCAVEYGHYEAAKLLIGHTIKDPSSVGNVSIVRSSTVEWTYAIIHRLQECSSCKEQHIQYFVGNLF